MKCVCALTFLFVAYLPIHGAAEAPSTPIDTVEMALNSLEEICKKGGPPSMAAALAIKDFQHSCIDENYKIDWPSSIKLLSDYALVEIYKSQKESYAKVHRSTREARQHLYKTSTKK